MIGRSSRMVAPAYLEGSDGMITLRLLHGPGRRIEMQRARCHKEPFGCHAVNLRVLTCQVSVD